MTKNDYEMVARVISKRRVYVDMYIVKKILVNELCEAFKAENYNFNEEKFKAACKEEVESEDSVKRSRR